MNTFPIEIVLGALTFTAATLLGILVFLRNVQSWTNRLFLILAVFIDAYIFINYFSLHPPGGTPESQLLWIRLVMFITSFIGPTLLLLVHTFPKEKITMRPRWFIALFALMVASAAASLSTLVFKDIHYPEGEPIPIPGSGIPIFFIDFIGLFVVSFIVLLIKYLHSIGEERAQHRLLFFGVLLSFSLMGLSTVIFVVILQTSAFVFLGPIFTVILMSSIAYAIVRYRLFNIRVILAQALVIAIWVFLFSRIFQATTWTAVIIDASILFLTILFGILLIKSVKKEISQREQLEILTKQLQDANTRLKELDQLKSEFLSFASHQLRSPLTAIRGYASLILEKSFGEVTEKVHEAIEKIYQASHSMITVVEDFLNVSRIEQGGMRFDFTSASLQKIVEVVAGEQKVNAEQAKLSLNVDIEHDEKGYLVRMDAGKIKQVVMNLVDNAVKYTPSGGIILLSLRHDLQGRKIILSIKDTGIGIRQDIFPKLFTKFSRAKDASRINIKGTGLGLYIAKEIMNAHKGRIWVESEGEGKGSTFHLEFYTDIVVGS